MAVTAGKISNYILVGKITRPHGLKGEVKVYPFSGEPDGFVADYDRFYLGRDEKLPLSDLPEELEKARVQGNLVLLKFKSVSDRNSAEKLRDMFVFVHEDDLPDVEDGGFYLYELVDKSLEDVDGKLLGRVVKILEAGSRDLLVVREEKTGREVLVPPAVEFMVSIDEDKVVMDLPPGLFSL